jgi:hypothetical protein
LELLSYLPPVVPDKVLLTPTLNSFSVVRRRKRERGSSIHRESERDCLKKAREVLGTGAGGKTVRMRLFVLTWSLVEPLSRLIETFQTVSHYAFSGTSQVSWGCKREPDL